MNSWTNPHTADENQFAATSWTSDDEVEFVHARWRAAYHAIISILNRHTPNLLSLEAVRARVHVRGQRYLGVQSIPLDQIIGSEGRSPDFDRHFLPRTSHTKERWKSIVRAYNQGRALPPIDVYKLGDTYFVRDGNHRVSVARQHRQVEIEARVTELTTDVTLQAEVTPHDLMYLEEQSDFLEWTNLAQLRWGITIQVSQLGGYLDLIGHINRHRTTLSAERGQTVEREEAAAHWYDTVYLPVVTRIRESGLLHRGPGKTEADLFLAVLKHQDMLAAAGAEMALAQATEDFIRQTHAPPLRRRLLRLPGAWRAVG